MMLKWLGLKLPMLMNPAEWAEWSAEGHYEKARRIYADVVSGRLPESSYDEAERHLNISLSKYPTADAHELLGDLYAAQGFHQNARNLYETGEMAVDSFFDKKSLVRCSDKAREQKKRIFEKTAADILSNSLQYLSTNDVQFMHNLDSSARQGIDDGLFGPDINRLLFALEDMSQHAQNREDRQYLLQALEAYVTFMKTGDKSDLESAIKSIGNVRGASTFQAYLEAEKCRMSDGTNVDELYERLYNWDGRSHPGVENVELVERTVENQKTPEGVWLAGVLNARAFASTGDKKYYRKGLSYASMMPEEPVEIKGKKRRGKDLRSWLEKLKKR